MRKIDYIEALKLYGEYMQYDNNFKLIKNEEAKIFYIDDKNYWIIKKYFKFENAKEIIFNHENVVCDKKVFDEMLLFIQDLDEVYLGTESSEVFEFLKENKYENYFEENVVQEISVGTDYDDSEYSINGYGSENVSNILIRRVYKLK